jgi:hypothetical protein
MMIERPLVKFLVAEHTQLDLRLDDAGVHIFLNLFKI